MVVDWSDPQTFWLNVLHASLGVIMLLGILLMGGMVAVEMFRSRRAREN